MIVVRHLEGGLRALSLLSVVSVMALMSACSDPPSTGPISNNPCGDLCPVEECQFGVCVGDNEPDVGPQPEPDVPEGQPEDEPEPPKDCEQDGDCADEEFCFFANENADGVCQEGCREGGCPDGQSCDPETHACVDEPEEGCLEDGDCEAGEICVVPEDGGAGVCQEGCREDGDCGEGEICDEDTSLCGEGCREDGDCGEGFRCVDEECAGDDCAVDGDCPDDQFCDTAADVCREGCRGDEGCDPGEICDEGSRDCVEGCRDDGACDQGFYCDEDLSACLEGCRGDDECDPGNSCLVTDIGGGTLRQRCGPTPCDADTDCDVPVGPGEAQPFYCEEGEGEGICQPGCREDNCALGLFCNTDTRICEIDSCVDTADCGEGEFCDDGVDPPACVPGCDDDAQCEGGQPCNLDTNSCGCNIDDDCPGNQLCSLGQCVPRCDGPEDCPQGFFCEERTGLCIEGCLDDNFEPNDTEDTAIPIDEGSFDMRMCHLAQIGVDDRDCFSIQLLELDTIEVNLTFVHADGDLDLRLYDRNFTVLAISDSVEDEESISFEVQEDGNYTFCVEPFGGAFEVDYSLSVSVIGGQGCLDDAAEGGNDDTCAAVQGDVLDLVLGQVETIEDRTICEGDEDFVAVQMRAGQQLTATLNRTGGDDLDIQIIDRDCRSVVGVTQVLGDVRPIVFRAPADGVYTVRVFGELVAFEGSYALDLELVAGDATCPEDVVADLPVEPNDDDLQSTILHQLNRDEVLDVDNLSLCPGDEDWYRVFVTVPSDLIRVVLRQSTAEVPLRVEIRDVNGVTVLDSDQANSPSKTVETLGLPQAGAYFVRVSATGAVPEAGVSYSLDVLMTSANSCIRDEFEENNIRQAASLISSGSFEATMCRENPNEADFYRLLLGVGDRVTITLEYDHSIIAPLQTLPTILYGPGGEFDIQDFTRRDGNTDTDVFFGGDFLVAPSQVGEWVIEVAAGDVGPGLNYTLNVDVISPSCEGGVVEDFAEPNESCGQATTLQPFTPLNGFICGPTQDVDFFGVNVAAGQRLVVHMDYFHFDGNLDVDVFEPGGSILAGFSHQVGPNFEDVVIDNTRSGRYCVRVFANSPLTQNDYSIDASIEE